MSIELYEISNSFIDLSLLTDLSEFSTETKHKILFPAKKNYFIPSFFMQSLSELFRNAFHLSFFTNLLQEISNLNITPIIFPNISISLEIKNLTINSLKIQLSQFTHFYGLKFILKETNSHILLCQIMDFLSITLKKNPNKLSNTYHLICFNQKNTFYLLICMTSIRKNLIYFLELFRKINYLRLNITPLSYSISSLPSIISHFIEIIHSFISKNNKSSIYSKEIKKKLIIATKNQKKTQVKTKLLELESKIDGFLDSKIFLLDIADLDNEYFEDFENRSIFIGQTFDHISSVLWKKNIKISFGVIVFDNLLTINFQNRDEWKEYENNENSEYCMEEITDIISKIFCDKNQFECFFQKKNLENKKIDRFFIDFQDKIDEIQLIFKQMGIEIRENNIFYIDFEEFNRIIQKIEIIFEELKTLEGFKISKNSNYLYFKKIIEFFKENKNKIIEKIVNSEEILSKKLIDIFFNLFFDCLAGDLSTLCEFSLKIILKILLKSEEILTNSYIINKICLSKWINKLFFEKIIFSLEKSIKISDFSNINNENNPFFSIFLQCLLDLETWNLFPKAFLNFFKTLFNFLKEKYNNNEDFYNISIIKLLFKGFLEEYYKTNIYTDNSQETKKRVFIRKLIEKTNFIEQNIEKTDFIIRISGFLHFFPNLIGIDNTIKSDFLKNRILKIDKTSLFTLYKLFKNELPKDLIGKESFFNPLDSEILYFEFGEAKNEGFYEEMAELIIENGGKFHFLEGLKKINNEIKINGISVGELSDKLQKKVSKNRKNNIFYEEKLSIYWPMIKNINLSKINLRIKRIIELQCYALNVIDKGKMTKSLEEISVLLAKTWKIASEMKEYRILCKIISEDLEFLNKEIREKKKLDIILLNS